MKPVTRTINFAVRLCPVIITRHGRVCEEDGEEVLLRAGLGLAGHRALVFFGM